jgi:NitT/TauT family transport system ATP-binding protein
MPIILKNINKKYNNIEIFKNFSLVFEENNIYAITGKVGTGKTTLLNIISKLTPIDSGEIYSTDNKKISYLFQDNRLLKNKSVSDNIRFVLKDTMNSKDSNILIEKYLKMFDLYEYKDYSIDKLSGGMQKKLAIARALLVPNYDILLLDEPFNNIDIAQRNIIIKNITETLPKNAIVIIVTHDIENVKDFTDKIYNLNMPPNDKLEIIISN